MSGIFPDDVPASSLVYGYFDSFAASSGAPTSITGLAVGDIKIYKDGNTTERASTSGFVLLDTDGIDFDGIVGINGFSIDLSDNTTAGFYAANHHYAVVVSTITVDGQTVSFIAGTFWIEQTGGALALIKSVISGAGVNITQILGTAIATPATAGILDVNVKNIDNDAASASGTVTFPNATLASTTGAVGSVTGAVGSVTGAVGSVTGNVGGNVTGSVGSVVGAVGSVTGAVGSVTGAVGSVTGNVGGNVTGSVGSVAANGITASSIATDAIGAAEIAAAGANKIADHIIRRTQANARASADGDAVSSRSMLGMLSLHRNKKDVSGSNLVVKTEDDTTTFFTDALSTDAAAVPIIGVDPA